MNRSTRKFLRTLLQAIAGGGLTAFAEAVSGGIDEPWSAILLIVNTALIAKAQNWLEDNAKVPTLLPSPTVSGAPAPLVVNRAAAGMAQPDNPDGG